MQRPDSIGVHRSIKGWVRQKRSDGEAVFSKLNKKPDLKNLITLASWQSCIISKVCYVCVTQSHSIYFVRSLANKNVGRQSKLLLGELSFLEKKGWWSSPFHLCSNKSAVWLHPNALFLFGWGVFQYISLSGRQCPAIAVLWVKAPVHTMHE